MTRIIATLLALTAMPILAHDFAIADLTIAHPMAFSTTATALTGAGYLTVTNAGDTDDRLLEIRADFPRVMMHDTEMSDDGIARMFHVDGIDIPAGETVTFAPGGKHIMFMGLNGDPFEVGESFTGTLIFEQAGALEIEFKVEVRPEGGMDHSEMDMGN
jgi:copper(I)-binding protein